MISARFLAYQILLHIDQKASHPDRLIRVMLQRHSRMDERDRALTTELVYGVLRWQGRLDWHIDQLSKIKPKKIDPAVRIALRLALYQILLLNRIPSHAAVNESVKIIKASQPPRFAGFVNALLREALRRNGNWDWPSPENDPAEFLAITTSHPRWLVRQFISEIGLQEAQELCAANNQVAAMALRVNTLKSSVPEVMERLKYSGIEAESSVYLADALRVTGLRQDISRLPEFLEGLVQVQDEASQLVALMIAPKPGDRVLDLCSGFGGKSTHIGILMKNRGEIVSIDNSAWKIEELRENAIRQGIGIIRAETDDVLELSPEQIGSFDRVLLDAPCTGFGSIRRNPDIKWRRHPKDPFRFARLQKRLLSHAARFVKPGGVLLYATCTVLQSENDEVAREFSEQHPEFIIESAAEYLPQTCRSMADGDFFKSWPHRHGVDGFFGARWRRNA